MSDALVVINAGSSSIKFSVYVVDGATLALDIRGQVEGLTETPAFIARDANDIVVGKREWDRNALDHVGATAYLLQFIIHDLARHRVIGIGHRVVHGGVRFVHPVRIDEDVLRALEALIP